MTKNRKTKAHSMANGERTAQQKIEDLKIEANMFRDSFFQLKKSKEALEESNITAQKNLKNLKTETSLFRDAYFQLRKSKLDLQESEKKFRTVIEHITDVVFSINLSRQVTFVTPNVSFFGYTPQDAVGHNFMEFVHPDDVDLMIEKFNTTIKKGSQPPTEFRLRRKDGSYVFMEESSDRIMEKGKPVHLAGTLRDITDRKKVEEEIEALSRFPKENPSPVLRVSKKGIILYANPASKIILTRLNVKVGDILPNPFKKIVMETYRSSSSSSSSSSSKDIELSINDKYYYVVFSAIKASDYINLYFFDATARQKAEETLKKSLQLLRDTGEMAKVGGWELDLSTKVVSLTEEVSRIHGIKPGYKLKLGKALNFYAPESRLAVEAIVKKTAKTGEPYDIESLFIPLRSKDKIWVRSLGKAIYSGGKIVKLAGTFQNIDKYKKAEESLRDSEERFRIVAENLSDVVYEWDMGERVEWFGNIDDLMGYRSGEFPRTMRGWGATLHPEDYDLVIAKIKRHVEGKAPYDAEFRMRKKDGTYSYFSARGRVIRDVAGNPLRMIGAITDITERKKAEESLRQTETKFRSIFEGGPDGILIADIKTKRFIIANPAICDFLGYSEKELLNMSVMDIHPKNSLKWVLEQFMKQAKGILKVAQDLPCLRKDGSIVFADVSSAPMNLDGVAYNIGFFRDAANRRSVEEYLRSSEEKYKSLTENATDQIFMLDRKYRFLSINKAAAKLSNKLPDEMIGKPIVNFFPPNIAYQFIKNVDDVFKTGRSKDNFEEKMEIEGHVLFQNTSLSPVKNSKGQVIAVVGIVRDITEQKKDQEGLKESEVKYRTLVENIPQKIFMKDRDCKYLSVNESYARDLGVRPDDVVGKTDYDFYPKSLADKYRANDKRVMKSGHADSLEEKYLKKGREVWVYTIKTPVKDERGKVMAVLGIFWDITERKKMEETLRASEERYRSLVDSATDQIFMIDTNYNFLSVNTAVSKIFHRSIDKIVGKPITDFFPKEIISEFKKNSGYVFKTGKGKYNFEEKSQIGDQVFFNNTSLNPIKDSKGKVVAVMGILRDVTNQKKAEMQLQKSHDELEKNVKERTSDLDFKNVFLKMELENSLDGVLIIDPKGKVLSTSQRFADMWNIPKAIINTKDDKKLLGFVLDQLEDPNEFINEVKRLYSHQNEKTRALIKFKDGRVFDRYTAPLMSEDGKYFGRLWSFRDMSHEAKVDRAKSEFVSLASHQLRTPLTAIKWLIQVAMKKGSLNKVQKEFLDDALSSNSRMINLVNDLLNVSRLETGILTVNPVQEDVNKLLKELINEVKPTALKKRIDIKFPETKGKLMAYFDPELATQVVSALLTNAIDYSEEKKPITVSLRKKKNNFEISVHDNGVGISKSDQKNLFTKFFRSAEAAKLSTSGSGLGLYIVKKILDACHGNIICDSVLGKGTKFTVSLPLKMKGIAGGKTLIRDKAI